MLYGINAADALVANQMIANETVFESLSTAFSLPTRAPERPSSTR